MAECSASGLAENFNDDREQDDELTAIESIYSDKPERLTYSRSKDDKNVVKGKLIIYFSKLEESLKLLPNGATVRHLPPLTLSFELPGDYPSLSPPLYQFDAVWMTRILEAKLRNLLDQEWKDYRGMPILFSWIQLLENYINNEVKSFHSLDLESIVDEQDKRSEIDSKKPRAKTSKQVLEEFLRYDEKAEKEEFEKSWYECLVCGEIKSGKESGQFHPCGHVFCLECISACYHQRLKDSSIKTFDCLAYDCENCASQALLRHVLGTDEYERYDKLLLEKALYNMNDVVPCPRLVCGGPATIDISDSNAEVE
ncbi:hypothetical protein AB6A40_002403 [Gnathostoma spinigerum]|uniref:Uncharacterized protein n=1 Tax=Gnathostoma spinigerum TaxID=75299 RepID=A0ABD6EEB1_9BILA